MTATDAGFRFAMTIRWVAALVRTARPGQWPKNLLVFAAPVAGASLGRDEGFGYALVACGAFVLASAAVYFVNDVTDAERDRCHPRKRHRPVAAGELGEEHALAAALACMAAAGAMCLAIGAVWLSVAVAGYLVLSFSYSLALKNLPVADVAVVASGFVLRALGGAAATHVRPSGWFLLVCSLGALVVAVAKRYSELITLGGPAAEHRTSLRWYSPTGLRVAQRMAAAAMVAAYVLWALGEGSVWLVGWHLASTVPIVAALARFDQLSGRRTTAGIEDPLTHDRLMIGCELVWLVTFVVGL